MTETSFQQKYKVTLKTLGPVHIGSGEQTAQKDYIIVNDGKTLFLPDIGKLYLWIMDNKQNCVKEFEEFIGSDKNSSWGNKGRNNGAKRLGEFLKNDIGITEIPEEIRSNTIIDISEGAGKSAQNKDGGKSNHGGANRGSQRGNADRFGDIGKQCCHSMPIAKCFVCTPAATVTGAKSPAKPSEDIPNINWKISNEISNNQQKFSDIHLFMTDPLTKKPYIPGSSLKGALRTIIMRDFIEGKKVPELKESVKKLKELSSPLSELMRYVKVSDSNLLPKDCLKIYSKFDEVALKGRIKELTREIKGKNGDISTVNENNPHEIESLKRVCLKPNTKITFDVTFNLKEIKAINPNFSVENLQQKIENHYSKYSANYLVNFKNKTAVDKNNIIYLGGGAGFLSKTFWVHFLGGKEGGNNKHIFPEVMKVLGEVFDKDKKGNEKKQARDRRDHKNLGKTVCDCRKCRHDHKCGRLCLKKPCPTKFTKSELVNDFTDFGVSPRCLKLAKEVNGYLETGKCEISFEKISD